MTADRRPQTADRRPQTADRRPQTADRRPTFCALYHAGNEHILKEVGLLAYGMYKFEGYDAFIATYDLGGGYPNLKYLPGLRMEFIPRVFGHWITDSCLWVIKNAKRIDVFNIYWPVTKTFLFAFFYRMFNRKGKIYLKFDGYYKNKHRGTFWKRPLYRWLVRNADCVSTELEGKDKWLSEEWERRFICIPNPSRPDDLKDYRPFSQRSNVIITVSRLGTRQKATEILLEAFVKIADKIPNWTLKLAGPFYENVNIADEFYTAHPGLKERVVFTGEIEDRETLMNMYRDAKIFAFPSRWESFGIALTEAMIQGCFAVTSNIEASTILTKNFKYGLGSDVDDVDGLAKNLLYACTHEAEIESRAREGMEYTRKRCDLKRVCDTIASELNLA